MAKHAGGRPTLYKPEYCKKIIEYFDIEPYREREILVTNSKTGYEKTEYEEVANDLPTLSGFAHSINVNQDTLHEWCKKHQEFSEAFKRAKEMQEEILMTNGLRDNYNPAFAIFTAKNVCGWRDKQELEHSGALTFEHIKNQKEKYTKC